MNRIVLASAGFTDPRFVTYHQAVSMGGAVKKGEKGLPVVFWTFNDRDEQERGKPTVYRKSFTVFNVQQTTGLALEPVQSLAQSTGALESARSLIENYKDRPRILFGSERASYCVAHDTVQMPIDVAFRSGEAYLSTLAHEFAHSTMHPSRLDRKVAKEPVKFGSAAYSFEELVAEISASFTCAEYGFDAEIEQSAAYVQSWLRIFRNDKQMLIRASIQAQKATDWMLGRYKKPIEEQLFDALRGKAG